MIHIATGLWIPAFWTISWAMASAPRFAATLSSPGSPIVRSESVIPAENPCPADHVTKRQ
jgi:hypothetical protein